MMLVSQIIAGDALESHVAPLRPTLFVKEFLFFYVYQRNSKIKTSRKVPNLFLMRLRMKSFKSNNIQLVKIFGKLFYSTKWAFYVESGKKLVMIEC